MIEGLRGWVDEVLVLREQLRQQLRPFLVVMR